jgi:hypothetical protein
MARTRRGRSGALALAVAALACLARRGSGALLVRPEQDCINPSVNKVNEFNFFPKDFRSVISEPAPTPPGATVGGGGGPGSAPGARAPRHARGARRGSGH